MTSEAEEEAEAADDEDTEDEDAVEEDDAAAETAGLVPLLLVSWMSGAADSRLFTAAPCLPLASPPPSLALASPLAPILVRKLKTAELSAGTVASR